MYNQQVVRQVMQQEAAAFERLYRDCGKRIFDKANLIVFNSARAYGVVLRTFVDIYQRVPYLKNADLFDEWVYRLMRYHARSALPVEVESLKELWPLICQQLDLPSEKEPAEESSQSSEEEWSPILFPPETEDEGFSSRPVHKELEEPRELAVIENAPVSKKKNGWKTLFFTLAVLLIVGCCLLYIFWPNR